MAIGIIGLLTLGACSPAGVPSPDPTPPILASSTSAAPSSTTIAPTVAPPEPLLDPAGSYAVVVFTNHLPEYGQAAEGSADRPWARLHTTRDYLTMIRLIAETRAKVAYVSEPMVPSKDSEDVIRQRAEEFLPGLRSGDLGQAHHVIQCGIVSRPSQRQHGQLDRGRGRARS